MFDKLKRALGIEAMERLLSSVCNAYVVRVCSEDVRRAIEDNAARKRASNIN